MRKVRFILLGGGYKKVEESMYGPILPFLKDAPEFINAHYYKNGKWDYEIDSSKYFDIIFHSGKYIKSSGMFISHGIADKKWRNLNRVNQFEKICVSGKAWYDKMLKQGANEKKIFIGGYPKLDKIAHKNKIEKNSNKIRILHAPTHNTYATRRPCTSSYPRLNDFLINLNKDIFEVKWSTHPWNQENNNVTYDGLLWADVVISDCSSLLYEAMIMNIPVVFPDWLVRHEILTAFSPSFEEDIYRKNIGYHASCEEDMIIKIKQAYKNGLKMEDKIFIKGILNPSNLGKSGLMIAKEIERSL